MGAQAEILVVSMKSFIASLALGALFVYPSAAFTAEFRRFENLHNPTEYVFHVPHAKMMEVLADHERRLAPPPEPLHGALIQRENKLVYSFGLFDHYTKRYWTGRQERLADVNPPEAGRIGTIDADFDVVVTPTGDNRTTVSVVVSSFQQQIGRRYAMFPHFHKTHVSVNVKSDTYFEYLFLLRLGELLGEKGMPPIKGRDD